MIEHSVIEKAYQDFYQMDASHANKVDTLLALRYIHENLLSPSLTVKNVIEECNIKTHCFYDRFASEINLNNNVRRTPGEYIVWARIQIARRIIKNSDCNLKELAYIVGFNSYRSFYRASLKYLGCKPSKIKNGTI